MGTENLIATSKITVNAPAAKVWDALINPDLIKKYMFGATVSSNWTKGSAISWTGEINGKKYEDKGVIIDLIPEQRLVYSHFSPLSGKADIPDNYHTVTVLLDAEDDQTQITLEQDKNETEKSRAESEKNWNLMLEELKKLVEAS
ncbi:SRPBCC domain-containing protein [Niabella pedocola]|uniref:SRPBCC domain-containing protein n=1 Tax=Niabella pedocola TaxID=1752077 RepID=A0ABS8PKC2_9BACT|nr:SRPBCC family protein [Niabella pedocola]MCD2421545.1 SRPBCC domain-containing protein [Niabella pedocola]